MIKVNTKLIIRNIDISDEEKKDKYNKYVSEEIKGIFENSLKYHSRYLR